MTRLDRLELVVRSLADRVLGEEYTFDAIAEQEAAEQGVSFSPPAVDKEGIVADVLARLPAPQAFDATAILAEISAVQQRLSALSKLVMDHEKDLQAILQTEVVVEDKGRAVAA
ncbi:hypothetical protein [Hyphomicrobium sp. DMF-1]|uniref:hypothetical protein n=1 Tax=Hyphomicrobium sp. DMF-1 TaxID=3019544 RepID=UPI0022EC0D82|nr:hypothetical protein [Hyphomicrobium sp. DMF-1]WBT40177.1 hypothetical protein PE058_09925 [Hyphomicrobium sp. DMF-1]